MSEWLVFESRFGGHRQGYLGYFSGLAGEAAQAVGFSLKNIAKLLFAPKVVFSTADDYFFGYLFLCCVRKLMGKESVGVLIRAEYCVSPMAMKHIIKRKFLKLQLRFRLGRSLTIMPFSVEPRLEALVSDWIYDPAFFMRNMAGGTAYDTDEEVASLVGGCGGKTVYLFLGALSEARGFKDFVQFAQNVKRVRGAEVRFIAAGKNTLGIDKEELVQHGIHVIPSLISEDSFNLLMRRSDVIWCAFSQEYDQFSGIFCNAYMLNKRVILRVGSRLERFSVQLGASRTAGEHSLATYVLSRFDSGAAAIRNGAVIRG